MIERIQRIGLFVKSALFTIVIHGILLVILLAGQWQFSQESIKRGTTKPIQAQVISTDYIQQQKAAKLAQEKKQLDAEKKRKQEVENKRLATEKKRKQEVEKKRLDAEKKREDEAEKARHVAEKLKREQEKKRLQIEEKKRLVAEKKREDEAEKARRAAEKLKREQALKDKLEEEKISRQLAQTKLDAATALSVWSGRIASAVQRNHRRPLNSAIGLVVKVRVKLSRNGDLLSANVVESSGNRLVDEAAELAFLKTESFPAPPKPEYQEIIILVKNE